MGTQQQPREPTYRCLECGGDLVANHQSWRCLECGYTPGHGAD